MQDTTTREMRMRGFYPRHMRTAITIAYVAFWPTLIMVIMTAVEYQKVASMMAHNFVPIH